FKGVVQSVIILEPGNIVLDSRVPEGLKAEAPGPIHEIQTIVTSLNETGVRREPTITRLAASFTSQPGAVVDLLADRRPIVRGAAVEALARSNNSSLAPLLWMVVDDKDPLVAEAAARVLATKPDVINELIAHSVSGNEVALIGRVWPFMP